MVYYCWTPFVTVPLNSLLTGSIKIELSEDKSTLSDNFSVLLSVLIPPIDWSPVVYTPFVTLSALPLNSLATSIVKSDDKSTLSDNFSVLLSVLIPPIDWSQSYIHHL